MRLLFLCLLLALLGSCRQDPTTGTTTVSGQVVDQARRQPVPNAHVQGNLLVPRRQPGLILLARA